MRELEQHLLAVEILVRVLMGKRWLFGLYGLNRERRRGGLVLVLLELLPLLLGVIAVQIPIELGHHARLLEVLGPLLGVLTLQQPPLRRRLHRELHLALCLKVEEVGVFDLDRLPLIVIFDTEPVPQATWTRRRGLTFVRR